MDGSDDGNGPAPRLTVRRLSRPALGGFRLGFLGAGHKTSTVLVSFSAWRTPIAAKAADRDRGRLDTRILYCFHFGFVLVNGLEG